MSFHFRSAIRGCGVLSRIHPFAHSFIPSSASPSTGRIPTYRFEWIRGVLLNENQRRASLSAGGEQKKKKRVKRRIPDRVKHYTDHLLAWRGFLLLQIEICQAFFPSSSSLPFPSPIGDVRLEAFCFNEVKLYSICS